MVTVLSSPSRRNFIQFSAAALLGESVRSRADERAAGSEITLHITDAGHRFASGPGPTWQPAGSESPPSCISIQPEAAFQEILGFGAAFTDASCYLLHQLSAAAREQLFEELFSPSKLGLNVCRTCIGASDYSTSLFSYDEGDPDPDLARFSIDHDREYILPTLVGARKYNPQLFLLASPWSPPGWMKVNHSMLGGLMEKQHFPAYAKYMVKFIQAYAAAGVRIDAVTVQNEVDTDQDARMPASLWGQEYETGFVSGHLGPSFRANHIQTKIWLIDHNYNLWGRAICELDDPNVNQYVDGIAWHGYLGEPSAMTRVHRAHPEKHMYWTEGGPAFDAPDYQTDWAKWGASFAGILRNWARCIIAWNLALDENGKPNLGPFNCGGTVTIHSETRQIIRSGQYWAFAHCARAARPGARRIESSGDIEGVSHVAFANPDGRHAVVFTNRGAAKQVAVRIPGKQTQVTLPPDSLVTMEWNA